MKNKLVDLNNHLFAQMERLSEEDMTPDRMALEVDRTEALVSVAQQIVSNANLQLQAVKLVAQHGDRFSRQLPMIGSDQP